jgi:NitT/TauT family transport system substrate-binding protein
MSRRQGEGLSRRKFLGGLTLAGTAGLLGLKPRFVAAEPPPETTRLTLAQISGLCVAPQYMAEELLQGEGFTEVQYIKTGGNVETFRVLDSGEAQISMAFVGPFIIHVDTGHPIVLLGGIHVGCFELFATEQVRAIRDLKGKTVAVPDLGLGSAQYVFLASMLSYVGLDPGKDVNWVVHPRAEGMRLLAEEKIDAFMGFPPEPQELRAKKIGHVVVNSAADRPWSQYFCCMVASSREFVRKHPVAVKRALRAILKATDVCALEPDRAARSLVDKGLVKNYDYALQTMQEVPYNRWREYNPEDTVRFYALRLHEAGMIKSSPQKLIAQGTDWRFLNELKKELKG